MRLSKIIISNVLGIARADVDLLPVTVFAGANAVGKSSIADAVSLAFTGQSSRADLKKKDFDRLLHDGAAKGRVAIDYESEEAEDNAEFRLPKGEQFANPFPGIEFLQYTIRPSLFNSLDSDAKRTMLFDLTGCKATGKLIRTKLEARGISVEVIDDFMTMLKGGFPSASKEAYARATAAKGEWKGITKQTWGSVIAESWEAPEPEGEVPTEKKMSELLALTTKRQKDLEDGIAFIASSEAQLAAEASRNERLSAQQEIADLLKRRKTKMAVTQKDLTEWEAKLPALQETMDALKSRQSMLTCPCCEASLQLIDGVLQESKGLKADTNIVSDAALALTNCKNAIEKLRTNLRNDQRDIDASIAAAKQVEAIKAEGGEPVDMNILERARDSVIKLRASVADLRAEFNAKQEMRNQAAGREKATADAAAAQAKVKLWLSMGDALAPDGIPSEILADALAPVNQSVGVLAGMCGWFKAEIGADMRVSYGDRLYDLCSASEKWRCDALLALAFAQISRVGIAVLDGFDIMIPKDRLALVNMAKQLTELESMDSILLLGTLKEMPNFDRSIGRVWITGSIAENV